MDRAVARKKALTSRRTPKGPSRELLAGITSLMRREGGEMATVADDEEKQVAVIRVDFDREMDFSAMQEEIRSVLGGLLKSARAADEGAAEEDGPHGVPVGTLWEMLQNATATG